MRTAVGSVTDVVITSGAAGFPRIIGHAVNRGAIGCCGAWPEADAELLPIRFSKPRSAATGPARKMASRWLPGRRQAPQNPPPALNRAPLVKGLLLTGSLSVLLPTFESQSTLVRSLSQLLEVLPELTARCEVVIIDDGSADDTGLIAREWATSYPQIRVAQHAKRLGQSACMRTGVAQSKYDTLLYWDEACDLDCHGLHKMWRQMPNNDSFWDIRPSSSACEPNLAYRWSTGVWPTPRVGPCSVSPNGCCGCRNAAIGCWNWNFARPWTLAPAIHAGGPTPPRRPRRSLQSRAAASRLNGSAGWSTAAMRPRRSGRGRDRYQPPTRSNDGRSERACDGAEFRKIPPRAPRLALVNRFRGLYYR